MGGLGNMPHGAAHDVAGWPEAAIVAALGPRTVTLVGMMGAGKSSIGRRLALRLGIPFVDADVEIEKAAGMTINDIFAVRGEAEFDVLMKRIKRRHDRPLLKTDDPGATLRKLMEERDPVYALADLTVQSREVMHEKIVDEIVSALAGRMGAACAFPGARADGGHEP